MKNYVQTRSTSSASRFVAVAVAASFLVPTLAGCGGQQAPAPTNAPQGSNLPRPVGAPGAPKQGMSTKTKVALLVGAAALYYMYTKKKNAAGQTVQYYKSESTGRIYYRDPKNPKQAIWVTPPAQGIQVPMEQAQEYSRYQGYNNQTTGQAWGGYNNGQFAPGSER